MMPAQKEKPGGHRAAEQNKLQHSNRSTATEAQLQRVIKALKIRPHTSHELFRAGIYHPPRRIKDLRERGYWIKTARVNLIDRDGYSHARCALYTLVSEPAEAAR